jgi:lantibiotic modifying enzyme
MSLFRLAAVSQDQRYYDAALATLAYERDLFTPDRNNWPDLRKAAQPDDPLNPAKPVPSGEPKRSFMTAWCHGAAGIGLARLASLPYQDDIAMRVEINTAITTTMNEGFGINHALCHGDLGNLDLLLYAHQQLPETISRENLGLLTATLVNNMRTQGWQSGIPASIENPGLMTGLAGAGYEMLRVAAPERVPSVLVLGAPVI